MHRLADGTPTKWLILHGHAVELVARRRDDNVPVQQTLDVLVSIQHTEIDQLLAQLLLDAIEALRHRLKVIANNGRPERHLPFVQLDQRLDEKLGICVVLPAMRPHQMQHRVTVLVHFVRKALGHLVEAHWEVHYLALGSDFLVQFLQFEVGRLHGEEMRHRAEEGGAVEVRVEQQHVGGETVETNCKE